MPTIPVFTNNFLPRWQYWFPTDEHPYFNEGSAGAAGRYGLAIMTLEPDSVTYDFCGTANFTPSVLRTDVRMARQVSDCMAPYKAASCCPVSAATKCNGRCLTQRWNWKTC